jgi:hypothetical protein
MEGRGMSIIKDGAKTRIGIDRERMQPRSGLCNTPFSNQDEKDDNSKGRSKISIMERSSDYKGKGDTKQKLRLAMRQRKRKRPRARWVRQHS